MARVNVYLPDELADAARRAHLNISSVTQRALQRELKRADLATWLDEVAALPPIAVSHEEVLAAVDAAREDLGRTAG